MPEIEPFDTPELSRLRTELRSTEAAMSLLRKEISTATDARFRELEAVYPEACFPCGRSHACMSCSPNRVLPGPGCMNCRQTGCAQLPCLACRDATTKAPR